jgi:hypothetical protein
MTPLASRDIRSKAFEIKFVVDRDLGHRIREAGRRTLAADPWAAGPAADEYRTTTVYFDTEAFDVYRRRGSYGRARYRIRRYGQDAVVFLERKLRTPDVLSKRRTGLAIAELGRLDGAVDCSWPGRWFHDRLQIRRMSPKCQVSYSRTARVGMTDGGPIRLTFDDDLAAGVANTAEFEDASRVSILRDKTIVEMKFTARMPAAFRRLVEDFALEPVRVSKYRLGIEATHGVASRTTRGLLLTENDSRGRLYTNRWSFTCNLARALDRRCTESRRSGIPRRAGPAGPRWHGRTDAGRA